MKRLRVVFAATVLVTLPIGPLHGQIVLTFDDIPSHTGNDTGDVIRTEYADLGVHFNGDGRHSGIVRQNGPTDPGNWDLTGTNGPQFLGHNSYGQTGVIEFDMPISFFQVDAAEGHSGVFNLTFEAYDDTGLLEAVTLPSTVPEVWETITLSSTGITRIEYHSQDAFGLDNMRFIPEPATLLLLGLGGLILRKRRQA